MGRLAKVDSFLTYSILDLVHFSQKRNHLNEHDSKSDENHRDVAEKRLSQRNESMDQRAFVFATRGHCIKGKQCQYITIKNQYMSLCSNNLAYFPFMHCPLVAN